MVASASPALKRAVRVAVVGVAVGVAAGAGVAVAGAPASPFELALDRAAQRAKAHDFVGALAALRDASAVVAKDAPLVLPAVVVTDAPHSGLGHYRAAPGAAATGGTLLLYVEVENLVPRARVDDGQGDVEVAYEAGGDFFVENENGVFEPLGHKDLGAQVVPLHRVLPVHSFGLTVGLGKDAPAGRYAVDVAVTDAVSRKRATRRVLFVVPPR